MKNMYKVIPFIFLIGCENEFAAAPQKLALSGEAGEESTAAGAHGDIPTGAGPTGPTGAAGEPTGPQGGSGGSSAQAGAGGLPVASTGGYGGLAGDHSSDPAGTGGTPEVGGAGGTGGTGGSPACSTQVGYSFEAPNILLLVERSNGMAAELVGGTGISRWAALRSTLTAPGIGFVPKYQSKAAFGLGTYSAKKSTGDNAALTCPFMAQVSIEPDNSSRIAAGFLPEELPADLGDSAPTAEAIESAVTWFSSVEGRKVLVLFTSHDPGTCDNPNDQAAGLKRALADVQLAYENGITTYAVGMGTSAGSTTFALANAGQGQEMPYTEDLGYTITDPSQLDDALTDIITGELGCTITLDREVSGTGGVVRVDGITSQEGKGWELTGPQEIEFLGSTCEQLKVDVAHTISITFPCE